MADTIKSLASAIISASQKVLEKAKFDVTRRGVVQAVSGSQYTVLVQGQEYTACGAANMHAVGDIVYVLFAQGDEKLAIILPVSI